MFFFQCWSKPTTTTSTSWSKPTTEKPSWEEPWKPSSSSKDGKSSKSKSSKSTTTSSKSSKSKGGYQPCKDDWDCPSGSGCYQVDIPKWYPGYDIDEKEDEWKSWATTTNWKSAMSTTAGSVSTIVMLLMYAYVSEVVTHIMLLFFVDTKIDLIYNNAGKHYHHLVKTQHQGRNQRSMPPTQTLWPSSSNLRRGRRMRQRQVRSHPLQQR